MMNSLGLRLTFTAMLLATLTSGARADVLFVDASNPLAGDGTSRNPFQDLGRAVEAARSRAGTTAGTTVIQVASGVYIVPPISYALPELRWRGVHAPTGSLNLDFPDVKIMGATQFEVDELGRPVRALPGTESIVQVLPWLGNQEQIARISASRVTISGLVFDGHDGPFGGADFNRAIDVDGQGTGETLSGISIRRNVMKNVANGIQTRLASLDIEENLFGRAATEPGGPGLLSVSALVGAGSETEPAWVRFSTNRSVGNRAGVAVQAVTNNEKPPADPDAAVPQAIVIEIAFNDLRNSRGYGNPNGGAGVRFLLDGLTGDPTKRSWLSAQVHDNQFDGSDYGLILDTLLPPFFPFGPSFPDLPSHTTNVEGRFDLVLAGNGYGCTIRNRALFTFTRSSRSLGVSAGQRYTRLYTFDVTDAGGELDGAYDRDHPSCDPDLGVEPGVTSCPPGTALGNSLWINGALIDNGTSVTLPGTCPSTPL